MDKITSIFVNQKNAKRRGFFDRLGMHRMMRMKKGLLGFKVLGF
jgi:hypothetical protein